MRHTKIQDIASAGVPLPIKTNGSPKREVIKCASMKEFAEPSLFCARMKIVQNPKVTPESAARMLPKSFPPSTPSAKNITTPIITPAKVK